MANNLNHGDCLQIIKSFKNDLFDSLVTDPPAGISFMGKEWDHHKGGRNEWIAWMTEVMTEAHRVMKPGAHGLVWALPRTSHWTATALENAGFEVRDVVTHLFGTGFPKSLNLGEGRGTALKPASEHWILVRKPCSEKTVAANVLKHGTGGLNIDACRVGNGDGNRGRFPANLVLDEHAAEMLDEQSKDTRAGKPSRTGSKFSATGSFPIQNDEPLKYEDSNVGASRFFYVAKASKADRNAGLEGMPDKEMNCFGKYQGTKDHAPKTDVKNKNHHPTVKSTKLMQYLIKLVTPPGGTVLDPFMGSGSTGVAAKKLGFSFVGIEKEKEYFDIARKRLQHGE